MAAYIARLSGDDWQNWANQLLSCHYGPVDYQTIPDNDRGDAGLEGFAVSDGHAFQAYGCEEPIGTQERYTKQRDKMTTDIAKFIANQPALSRIFGSVKISRWVLFVPYFDSKEIVAHAANKTAEVLAANLPYVSPGFRVIVNQEDDFVVARDKLLNASSEKIEISTDSVSQEDLSKWSSTNDALTEVLHRKLRKLATLPSEVERDRFKEKVLRWYLDGQAVLEGLRRYPQVYERVIKTKAHREGFLVMASVAGGASHEILTKSLSEFLDSLQTQAKELHKFSAEKLAYEAVADWLLRCPLDFPGGENV